MIRFLPVLVSTLTCLSVFSAGVFEVYTVTDLTNAFANAKGNIDTTIKIHPGVYYVGDIAMSGASHLATVAGGVGTRFIYGTGDGPSDVVIVGRGADSDSGLSVISGDKHAIISNITVTGGCSASSGGGINNIQSKLQCCILSNNYAKSFGGALDGGEGAIRCLFENNRAGTSGGALRPMTQKSASTYIDCQFINNRDESKGGGVAYYGAVWSNCLFSANSSAFGHSVAKPQGFQNVFIDCTFCDNRGAGGYGCIDGAVATNCIFVRNSSVDGLGTLVADKCPDLVGCTFSFNSGMPSVKESVLRNCTFTGNAGYNENSNDLIMDSTLYNCLVAGNVSGNHSMAEIIGGCDLFNCTVVSNSYQGVAAVCGGCAVNSIIALNYDRRDGFFRDINYSYVPAMTNSLWMSESGTPPEEGGPEGGGRVDDIRFADPAAGDYSLLRRSPARNAGWSDSAYLEALGGADLSGKPRVFTRDGAGIIDVGCYEIDVLNPGLLMILR